MNFAILLGFFILPGMLKAAVNPTITDELINLVNSNPESTWTAGHNVFSDWELDQFTSLLSDSVLPTKATPLVNLGADLSLAGLPESFDARTKWSTCIHPILDQGNCGSCWAHAASEVLSDRYCIASGGATNVVLSPQDLTSCDANDFGCDGGLPSNSWDYLSIVGAVTDACFPYTSGAAAVVPTCPAPGVCPGTGPYVKYKSTTYNNNYNFIQEVMWDLMFNGPVEVVFEVYGDFPAYTSGVYQRTSNEDLGGHAVKLVGWGTENGTPYWLVANSWNTTWGIDGYFKIIRGVDECGIEDGMIAGYAAIPNLQSILYVAPAFGNILGGDQIMVAGTSNLGTMDLQNSVVTIGGQVAVSLEQQRITQYVTVILFNYAGTGNTGSGGVYDAAGTLVQPLPSFTGANVTVGPFEFLDGAENNTIYIQYDSDASYAYFGYQLQMESDYENWPWQYTLKNAFGFMTPTIRDSAYIGATAYWAYVTVPRSSTLAPGFVDITMTNPSTGATATLANAFYYTTSHLPGTPGTPVAVEKTTTSITLNWAAPPY